MHTVLIDNVRAALTETLGMGFTVRDGIFSISRIRKARHAGILEDAMTSKIPGTGTDAYY
jgi:hypothetical protein